MRQHLSTNSYKSVVDITISTYLHNTNPINIENKAHKAKGTKIKVFTSKTKDLTSETKAKDTTFEAKAKDMTSCPQGASGPRPWP